MQDDGGPAERASIDHRSRQGPGYRPAPNTIRRLRKKGHEIRTYWTHQSTEPGRPPHRVAKYILMREAS
ncbi:helix-turn-helix domain-containing protein [Pseudomonas sp. RTB3]|nr:helix-turn-helix domain-containing protein [Pseudomonas sp. RTB3]